MICYAKPDSPMPPPRLSVPLRCGAVHAQRRVRCILGAHSPDVRHSAAYQSSRGGIQMISWGGT